MLSLDSQRVQLPTFAAERRRVLHGARNYLSMSPTGRMDTQTRTQHKRRHFGDFLPSQSLGSVLKSNQNPTKLTTKHKTEVI